MTNHQASRGGVLVLGDYRQTLTVVRSLSRAGYRVILGRCGAGGAACVSRYVTGFWEHPPLTEDSAHRFHRALSAYLASNPDTRCVFPIGEKEISFLTRHRGLLPTSAPYAMPGEPIVTTCLSKISTLELLHDLDIPHAGFRIATSRAELRSAIEAVGYPCVVKAETEQTRLFGRKALVLRSSQASATAIAQWPDAPSRWIVQKYFDGNRHNVYFFAENGQPRASVEVRIERTDRADGTGYAVEGVSVAPSASLREYTARLIERLDYTGAGCAQFLVDETAGTCTFLEINARLGANFAIAHHCGLDLPRWWVETALPGEAKIPVTEGTVGKRYAWLCGDVQGFKHSLFAREAPALDLLRWPWRILRAWSRADVHVTWDWRDPLPTLSTAARMIGGPVRRMASLVRRIPRVRASTGTERTLTSHAS